MADTYDVLYTGLKPGIDLEQAVAAFAARFRVHPQRVRDLFESGGAATIRAGLNRSAALEYRAALDRIGLQVRVDPHIDEAEIPESGSEARSGPPAADAAAAPRDPFEPPTAALEDTRVDAFHEPRSVPASQGWGWLREGFSMVFASPLNWIAAIVIWTVLNIVLNVIPIVNLLAAMIMSVFMGGLMLGAHEQRNGGTFTIGHLFAGFSNKLGPLLLVGVLYMVGLLVIMLVVGAGMGGIFLAATGLSGGGATVPEAVAFSPMLWIFMLLGLALMIPLLMAYWFAPTLVMIDDVSAVSAMGMSFRACLKNILPFLLYGLIASVLFILAAVPLFLGLLIIVPVIVASVYASYSDIFRR